MIKGSKKTVLTQELFDLVKALQETKMATSKIKRITGASVYTQMQFAKCKKFEDYEGVCKAYWESYKKTEEKKEVLPEVKPLKEKLDEHNSIVTLLRAIEHNQQQMIALMTQKKSWFR